MDIGYGSNRGKKSKDKCGPRPMVVDGLSKSVMICRHSCVVRGRAADRETEGKTDCVARRRKEAKL